MDPCHHGHVQNVTAKQIQRSAQFQIHVEKTLAQTEKQYFQTKIERDCQCNRNKHNA